MPYKLRIASVGTDMIDLVGKDRRHRRPHSSLGFHSSKEENNRMYFGDRSKKEGRRVPKTSAFAWCRIRHVPLR